MLGHSDVAKAETQGNWRGKPFILTYSGLVFPFDKITPECIDIRDIAHSLSHLCRYTGHTNMFYSVAQHSLLVSEKVTGGPTVKLCALLHDAAEAYTNDLASPLKKWLEIESDCGSLYASLQDSITAVIYNKYGVSYIHEDVKLYDTAAGVFEAEGFMGLSPKELGQYSFPMHLRGLWQPWHPQDFAEKNSDREFGEIETQFLERYEQLMYECGREPI